MPTNEHSVAVGLHIYRIPTIVRVGGMGPKNIYNLREKNTSNFVCVNKSILI